ncbi:hypothetical protein DFP73DRAFT_257827 [Morchella snyderi]|nr:hypothetical protein DFP73DRAFT_257827 [Morchella snyderi]
MLNSNISFNVDQKRERYAELSEIPQPPARPILATRHSSAVSATLGNRIQRHLDAGKPLYIGFDPTDPPRNSSNIQRACEEGGVEGRKCEKSIKKDKQWVRFLTFGAPLDIAVKFILTFGMMMALVAVFWATNRVIQNRRLDKDFNLILLVGQIIWGVFFGASCIFGMELMWGKWRVRRKRKSIILHFTDQKKKRSPSAALFFTVSWVLISIVLLITSAVWIYFYLTFRASLIERCMEQTVRVTTTWEKDSLRRVAPKAQIDGCLSKVGPKVSWTLAWGILYALSSYSGLVVVIWGRDYRKRLLEIKECEEARMLPRNSENDKVGLLLGTAPLGGLPSSRAYLPGTNDVGLR